ncbi:hypothetical protein BJI67_01075 [Acidihalobacter aeolianus]|uniref:Outer membrane lipoprotein carrier protein LolA n=1 Tax=Acidihalobacter aeolianus TaxID=2792603 RepID=A0A1D8K4F8_9GAMM|nr:outer membrane lipoprotein carrier protein LolA [Acidihalobacter aeolianus]AOV15845.1 hypothetical protein BJI67_01075 [Acidihalobacter aeolianus]
MTTGNPEPARGRRHVLAVLAFAAGLIGLLACQPAGATGWNLTDLLAGFSRVTDASADYTEVRHSSFVDVPLVSHGRLVYRAPGYLAKTGEGGGYVVQGNVAEILGSDPPRRVQLDDYPPLAALIAALRATLSGNAAVLHRYFKPELSGDAAAWRLRLLPLQASLNQAIEQIELYGSGNRLRRVEVAQSGGDRSRLTLSRLVVHERKPAS